jgi:hypothetical protein
MTRHHRHVLISRFTRFNVMVEKHRVIFVMIMISWGRRPMNCRVNELAVWVQVFDELSAVYEGVPMSFPVTRLLNRPDLISFFLLVVHIQRAVGSCEK